MAEQFEVDVAAAGQRLDRFLAAATHQSRGAIRRAIESGSVWVDDARVRVQATPVVAGQRITLHPTPLGAAEPRVVYEDEDLLILDKPAGLPTSPPPEGGSSALSFVHDHLGLRGKDRVGEVHRLDRDASGLLVFGTHREAVGKLGVAMQRRRINRGYLAWIHVARLPEPERIEAPLRGRRGGGVEIHATGAPAVTRMVPLCHDAAAAVACVALSLETGRMHQIRAHLAWAVGPILGDLRYGAPRFEGLDRIALHASRLALRHPRTGQGMSFTAAIAESDLAGLPAQPADPTGVLRELGRGPFESERALAALNP